MNTGIAESKIRDSLDSVFPLESVLHSDTRRTIWSLSERTSKSPFNHTALVLDTSSDANHQERRYREAKFFRHPNLISLANPSRINTDRGEFSYFLTPHPSGSLTSYLSSAAWSLGTLIEVAQQILEALSYIHEENLLYCALNAASVWNVGDQWQLSDFSELRIPGVEEPEHSRKLMTQGLLAAPPEVYFGQISSAWDIWSFGNMFGGIFRPSLKRQATVGASIRPIQVPDQIEELIASCSDPNPEARPTLPELREFFHSKLVVSLLRQDWEEKNASSHQSVPSAQMTELENNPPEQVTAQTSPFREDRRTESVPPQEIPAPLSRDDRSEVLQPQHSYLPDLPSPRLHNVFRNMDPEARNQRKINWSRIIPIATILVGLSAAYLVFERDPLGSRLKVHTPNHNDSSAQTGNPESTASSSAAVAKPKIETRTTEPSQDISTKQQIGAVLDRWVSATRRRDVAEQVNCYGPVVDTYYSRHHLTTAELASEKIRAFSDIGPVRQFEIRNIRYDHLSPDWAVVSFDKHWAFGEHGTYSGATREQLIFREIGSEWKITSERELRVYSVKRRS